MFILLLRPAGLGDWRAPRGGPSAHGARCFCRWGPRENLPPHTGASALPLGRGTAWGPGGWRTWGGLEELWALVGKHLVLWALACWGRPLDELSEVCIPGPEQQDTGPQPASPLTPGSLTSHRQAPESACPKLRPPPFAPTLTASPPPPPHGQGMGQVGWAVALTAVSSGAWTSWIPTYVGGEQVDQPFDRPGQGESSDEEDRQDQVRERGCEINRL